MEITSFSESHLLLEANLTAIDLTSLCRVGEIFEHSEKT